MVKYFISYRAADTALAAALVAQSIRSRTGSASVFLDTTSIECGDHFPSKIRNALNSCETMLVMIGDRWLTSDHAGNRRIDDARDYVRREIARALERRIRVVPVTVGDARLPKAGDLPADISAIVERQAFPLRNRHQTIDIENLVDALTKIGPVTESGARADPSSPPPAVFSQFNDRVTAGVIGVNLGHLKIGGEGD